MYWEFRPYVSAAQRRAQAERKLKQLAKQGRQIEPVKIAGRKITTTFWGQAWCDNLEAYSDFGNRLPRGRTYVRNGSVIDMQIKPGHVTALVSGSDLYNIRIDLTALGKPTWKQIKSQCAGRIGSLVDLLQGQLSPDVMGIVTDREGGMFPKPDEIDMQCSCPDYAYLCKHLAAVLYAIGARLDQRPELLFLLRKVDHLELITAAGERAAATPRSSKQPAIAEDALSEIFGIELESSASAPATVSALKKPRAVNGQGSSRRTQATAPPAASNVAGMRAKKVAGGASTAGKAKTPAQAKPSKRTAPKAAGLSPKKKTSSTASAKPRRRAMAW